MKKEKAAEKISSFYHLYLILPSVFYVFAESVHIFYFKHLTIKLGITQLMAGGGVALIGTTLVPLLSGLF